MLGTLLKTHRDPEDIDFASIWREGIFIFDSNVLLDLYRLPESASNDLINVLRNEKFNQRIWISFQAILEFLSNRHEAISDQKNKFNVVRTLIDEATTQYEGVFEKLSKELSKLKLKQRHSLIDPDKFITPDNISKGKSFLDDFIHELSVLENKQSDVSDTDKIKNVVLQIFNGKIGEGFSQKELDEICKNGEMRYENSIPPGYKDKSKQGSYSVKDREFIRKFGDLILWKELIRKAHKENISYLVLITGDVKEDWWLEKGGKKLGPRKELLNEIYTEAPKLKTFYLYDTSSFLRHAKSELKLDISDSSITQAKALIERGIRNRLAHEEGLLYLPDILRLIASRISGFRVGVGRSVRDLPLLRLGAEFLYDSLLEIFTNAVNHGVGNYVGVQAKRASGFTLLRFKNQISSADAAPQQEISRTGLHERGLGLEKLREMMSKEEIDVRVTANDRIFVLELYIPNDKFYGGLGSELKMSGPAG